MKMSHIIEAMREDYFTISVIFSDTDFESSTHGQKCYTYKVHKSIQISESDHVVVLAGAQYKICRVVEVHDVLGIDFESNINYKWIVCKVDKTLHEEIVESEKILAKEIKEAESELNRNRAKAFLMEQLGEDTLKNLQSKLIELKV